ncbi:protease modulator HflC [Sphingomonas sp. SUN039]|uniref:protease modulator HflC n=1 Tax=Sphingomonas sp. SUN039 TaxID=2937787 RepID=UPI002164A2C4|nr:protease modulator HflC [Sphingomonas sp. SUN039]UVO54689.1 protease modulator HflC [Sphingomonas sp. SUN039]
MSLIERFMRHPLIFGIGAIALLFLITNTIRVVPETQQGVVLRFGEPVALVNRYQPNQQFGASGAGLLAIIPFSDSIIWIDKRVRDVDMAGQQVLSTDQYRLNVDAFARYRITNPLQMYISARTEDRVADQLAPILGSVVRNELGKRQFAELLSPERGIIMQNIRRALDVQARQYGAEIVDVRIKKTDPPEGAPLDATYARMRSARVQEARTIEAQGLQQAQIIRADADAEAAGIYAAAYGKDPSFYDFYRAMQSYEHTFGADGSTPTGQSSIILSPGNDYLREFRGGNR